MQTVVRDSAPKLFGKRGRSLLRSLFLCLLGVTFSGCSSNKPKQTLQPVTVRMDVLLPLHPVWDQAEQLRLQAEGLKAMAPNALRPIAPSPAVASFQPPPPASFGLVQQRRKPLAEYSHHSMKEILANYKRRIDLIYSRFERVQRGLMEVRVQTRRTEIENRLREEQVNQARQIQHDLIRLGTKEVVFLSQMRVLTGPYYQKAREQRDAIAQQMKAKNQELTTVTADFTPKVNRELEAYRVEQAKELQGKLSALALTQQESYTRLQDSLTARTSAEGSQASEVIAEFQPMGASFPNRPIPTSISVGSLSSSDYNTLLQSAAQRSKAELASQALRWSLRREKLLERMRSDIRSEMERFARDNNWRLLPAGQDGGRDVTDEVREELRRVWGAPAKKPSSNRI